MRGSVARNRPRTPRKGFTLIELSVVMLIIGILMAFILAASYEGVQRAQVRATQALIAKLDSGFNQRLDEVMNVTIEPNGAHQFLASVYPGGIPNITVPPFGSVSALPWGVTSPQRAQVIARYDQVKRELPDVFYVDLVTDPNYPLNFAGPPYGGGNSPGPLNYVLPLGHSVPPGFTPTDPNIFLQVDPVTGLPDPIKQAADLDPDGDGNMNVGPGDFASGYYGGTTGLLFNPAGLGIYGASYSAAAGIYKNLGYLPAGYDGTDNDGDLWIDEYDEGVNATNSAQVTQNLQNHTHKTARAEMLYALLVEGQGSRGPIFRREDFKASEIGDTDNDGLPEFLDAWGEPVQFYRWPVHHGEKQFQIYFDSNGVEQRRVVYGGTQQGYYPYRDSRQPRERSTLDPNNVLVAPAWWSSSYNVGNANDPVSAPGNGDMSSHAYTFQRFFHPLVDLVATPPGMGATTNIYVWDLSLTQRRAFFSRHLIVSSGPDRYLGIPMLGTNYSAYDLTPQSAPSLSLNYDHLIQIENCASDLTPIRDLSQAPTFPPAVTSPIVVIGPVDAISSGIDDGQGGGWAQDDITNQNLPQAGGGTQ